MSKAPKKRLTALLGVIAVGTLSLLLVVGPRLYEDYLLRRLTRDSEFFAQTLFGSPGGVTARVLERYLATDEGKSRLFRIFYDAVVEKYPWLPENFNDGLHGVIQFEEDGKISCTMREPGNASWNHQEPTDRLRSLQAHLPSLQGFEFGLEEAPRWRFIFAGENPVEVHRELQMLKNACVLIGPRTPYPVLFSKWTKEHAFQPILVGPVAASSHDLAKEPDSETDGSSADGQD